MSFDSLKNAQQSNIFIGHRDNIFEWRFNSILIKRSVIAAIYYQIQIFVSRNEMLFKQKLCDKNIRSTFVDLILTNSFPEDKKFLSV